MADKPTIPDFPALPDFGQMITQACEVVASVRGIPYDFNGTLSLENKFVVLFKTVKEMFNAQDALVKSYKELHEFINTYFDNLDVQEEVNKKIDELEKNGTLSRLLSNVVGNDSYPTFVSSTDAMTNHKLVYVLSSNGHIYYYNNTWVDSGLTYGAFGSYTPSSILITPSNISSFFNDLNNAPLNKTVFLFDMTKEIMSNLPVDSVYHGVLSTFQHTTYSKQPGGYQLLITKKNIFTRMNTGTVQSGYAWSDWLAFNSNSYQPSDVLVLPSNIDSTFNDLNNAPLNKTVFLFDMTKDIMKNLPVDSVYHGALSTFQYSNYSSQGGGYQLLVTNDRLYYRLNISSSDGKLTWKNWSHNEISKTNYFKTFNFFRSFCTIGDSLSVGYHTLKNGNAISRDLEHSWPNYIKIKYNNTVYWSGKSGATCKSWLNATENTWGINYLKSIPQQPLYILCMGANETGIPIGTSADIGTDNDTLYGYISKVISEVRKYAPNCYIISTGISRKQGTDSTVVSVNNVYKDMQNFFENYFYADCMSELNSKPFTDLYNNFHYTPLGYSALAEFFEEKFDSILNENITKFLYA